MSKELTSFLDYNNAVAMCVALQDNVTTGDMLRLTFSQMGMILLKIDPVEMLMVLSHGTIRAMPL